MRPQLWRVLSPLLYVIFRSDSSVGKTGFSFSFSATGRPVKRTLKDYIVSLSPTKTDAPIGRELTADRRLVNRPPVNNPDVSSLTSGNNLLFRLGSMKGEWANWIRSPQYAFYNLSTILRTYIVNVYSVYEYHTSAPSQQQHIPRQLFWVWKRIFTN